ncbi:extracellular solute-binding protein [Nonomuraea roseoviolacea]|uniref:ABC-type glycerol-3-phosphate transport system substrate-binding protein n=1 Tax=Nonomuraea roseoviolacea subsp. carminata TaxID=160689 RepID=A0ABT1KBH0_9ACTN|nr:extracellular solute-binding protein [Nonomuraea roseoviolacea]MCP2351362.1 ABC-type glycerol-3-phosphate transport system substrate-binding protein [Nonomuraea roseoviolacea subsp. carminata]
MTLLTRRRLLAAAALTTASGLLAACGGSEPEAAVPADGVPRGKLSVWLHQTKAYDAVFTKLLHSYVQEFGGVDVTPLYVPVDKLDAKLLTAFAGDAPPDLFKIGGWTIAGHARKGRLAPIIPKAMGVPDEKALVAQYDQNAISSLSYQGRLYGVPIDYTICCLYYRRDRFAEAGLDPDKPPATWEEVAEYSKRLTSADGRKVGLQWILGNPQWTLMQLLALVKGKGGGILSADAGTATLASDAGVEALRYYGSVGNAKLSNPLSGFGLFATGQAAMVVSGLFAMDLFPALNKQLVFGESFDIAPLPHWDGGQPVAPAYTWGWAVAEQSKLPYTAWHFIDYLQREDVAARQLKDASLLTPVKGWEKLPGADPKAMEIMAAAAPHADFGPRTPVWQEMAKALTDAGDAVAFGKKPPERAAADFDQAMRIAL